MALHVSLPAELETLVHQEVKTGMYGSASEVVREALRGFFASSAERPLQDAGEPHTAKNGADGAVAMPKSHRKKFEETADKFIEKHRATLQGLSGR
jgi:putative addiction module CopG family antidote